MKRILLTLAATSLLLQITPAHALDNGWPVPSGSITSGVGWRLDPFGSGRMKWHKGVDIAVPANTPVTPTESGQIRYAGWYGDYGLLVVVDHHDGWFSMYGHNSNLAVKVGEEVTPETVIAYAGSTGKSTGVHVHYERRWFPQGATPPPAPGSRGNGKVQAELPREIPELQPEGFHQTTAALGRPAEEGDEPSLDGFDLNGYGGIGGD